MKVRIIVVLLAIAFCQSLFAQGDGSRSHILAPTGVWGINPKWLHLNQNIIPAGNVLVKDVDFTIDVVPTTIIHTFGIKGKNARVLAMINPGSVKGEIATNPDIPDESLSSSGFSDGFVAFEYGFIGAPALNIKEFTKHVPNFTLNGIFRLWYSGTYDSGKLVNLGTNRMTFEIGTPMAIPLSKNPERATWLEVFPSIQFFTDNTDPARSSMAQKTEQKPLFLLENHFSHNFTPKLWGGLDLRFQYGGETIADDIPDDNQLSVVGGGLLMGYQLLPFLGGYVNYGRILAGANGQDLKCSG